ncbi:MAG: DUF2304 domain-containing protein [Candidatus Veblenbacteria bacterium]|nr:DUF2304 domain-containing protein [Candidatus Veblenbacteria bacterium]
MTIIQFILLVVVLLILWRLYRRLVGGELAKREFVEWLLLWLAVAFLVLVPDSASYLANLVGVGRGSDLVVYAAVVLAFYLLFKIFLRLERNERELTTIVRSLALQGDQDKKITQPDQRAGNLK